MSVHCKFFTSNFCFLQKSNLIVAGKKIQVIANAMS